VGAAVRPMDIKSALNINKLFFISYAPLAS